MQKKIDSSLEDQAETMLSTLQISITDGAVKKALAKISPAVLVIVQNYCKSKELDPTKAVLLIDKISSPSMINIKLAWPILPIISYIQETLESQTFVKWRTGLNKSWRFVLLNALVTELDKIDIEDNLRISIAEAYLKQTLSDEIWESGCKGKEAIAKSLTYFSHIKKIQGNQDEIDFLTIVCDASAKIGDYRKHANSQYDLLSFFSLGRFKRQGAVNLVEFEDFLNSANTIIQNTSLTRKERVNQIIEKLNGFRQLLSGQKSEEVWQSLYTTLTNVSLKLPEVESTHTETSKLSDSNLVSTI
ncbi:hypothetical protein [Legionella sp. W05-934-2]|jgi:hypothetical protein|uniref:hypothetical protein n=1 Tax=Legionella sp. W05-934-2 TaxID=1198649 RepID=UPI003462EBB3